MFLIFLFSCRECTGNLSSKKSAVSVRFNACIGSHFLLFANKVAIPQVWGWGIPWFCAFLPIASCLTSGRKFYNLLHLMAPLLPGLFHSQLGVTLACELFVRESRKLVVQYVGNSHIRTRILLQLCGPLMQSSSLDMIWYSINLQQRYSHHFFSQSIGILVRCLSELGP